ncbi:MAG: NACHT domain-containing protein [Chromatiales bacterium]|nr:NACHT domain-containing protein [Gammaproteobacteria bacterium]
MLDDLLKKVTGGLDGVADELIKLSTDLVKEKVSEAFAVKRIETLKSSISRVGRVKTILDPDSIIELNAIFFEKAVSFGDETQVTHSSFFSGNHILIEGGPGQGKSLYLRYLCLNEGKGSNYIPIFIEFRNLKFERGLREELFEAINEFGIALDEDLFDYLAKSKKVLFILDGFDEIPNASRLRVARELETIARTYPDLKIIVSSRPGSGMGASVYFEKHIIQPLTLECQLEFIDHLYSKGSQANSIKHILENSRFISEVTTTPLLLTLFTITYNARQFKPDSLSEFYSLIFPTMLYRHDRLKIGFERERKSGLTDYQMQRLFEAFSFISLKDNKTRFSSPVFRKHLEYASKLERLDENLEDKLIDDITSITALVVKDGFDDYSFSHKSIQEYFSAVFISRLDEEKKSQFYQLVLELFDEFRKWQNTLSFLSTIDEKNYIKYFLIPYKKRALNIDKNGDTRINYQSLLQMIGEDSKVQVTEEGLIIEVYWGDTISSVIYEEYSDFAKQEILSFLLDNKDKIADFLAYCNVAEYEKYQHSNGNFILAIDALLKGERLQKSACKMISKSFDGSHIRVGLIKLEKELSDSETIMETILKF